MHQQQTAFENIVGKEEITHNSFNLEKSKICRLGKG